MAQRNAVEGGAGDASERPPERIALGELMLTRWRRADAGELAEAVFASLAHLRPWMPWAERYEAASAARFLAESETGWERGSRFEFAVRDRGRALLGAVGLLPRIDAGGLEVGYWVHAAHARRGVTTRAVAVLAEAAFGLAHVTHLEIHHDEANRASGAVAAGLGFRPLGVWPHARQALADSGREMRWRMDAGEFAGSPAAAVLAHERAIEPHDETVSERVTRA